MKREQKHTDTLTLRIEPALRQKIDQIAQAKDRSVAWTVRDALTRYIEQEHGPTRP